ncbi:MAG: hypothetical protein EOP11_26215 [Proteobacteria bacterium]|nr:MAG: hypothetical protein EOP11_26215 [Pseudomonadota bacterium]
MLKSFLSIGLLASVASSAFAAPASGFTCVAYSKAVKISLAGQTAGTRVVGNGSLKVTLAGIVLRSQSFVPRQSRFLVNDRLQFSAQSSDGTGMVDTRYAGGTTYRGRLQAVIDGDPVDTSIECKF